MNILIVSFPSASSYIGGEDQIAKNLKKYLEPSHNVIISSREDLELHLDDIDFVLSLNIPIKIIRKKNIIWATWIFNTNLGSTAKEITSYNFDIYFTNSEIIHSQIKDSIYLEIPPSDDYLPSTRKIDSNTEILYLGNYNPEYKTVDKINHYLIPCLKYNFSIFGYKWKTIEQQEIYNQGRLSHEHITNIYNNFSRGLYPLIDCDIISQQSKLAINFHSPDQMTLDMINNRMYDLLLNGCFIITDDTLKQRRIFGDAIEYSSGGNDLNEKISYYLSNPHLINEKKEKAKILGKEIYDKNNYQIVSRKILDSFLSFKESLKPLSSNIKILLIVTNIQRLEEMIKQFNGYEVLIYYKKQNRILANKIAEKYKCKSYIELDFSIFSYGDILIPLNTNIVVKDSFIKEIENYFEHNTNPIRWLLMDSKRQIIYGSSYDNHEDNIYPLGTYAFRKGIESSSYQSDIINEIIFDSSFPKDEFIVSSLSPEKKIIEKKEEEIVYKEVYDLRISIISSSPVEFNYPNIEYMNGDYEQIFRLLKSHYTFFVTSSLDIQDIQRFIRIISTHLNYSVFKYKENVLIKTSLLYSLKPCNSISEYQEYILSCNYSILEIKSNLDIKIIKEDLVTRNSSGLNIAVLSMCGVSSFEDKYGLGGEHQVVHWLKHDFEQRKDVYKVHIFDTINFDLMDKNEYDIIFSNSCWRGFPSKNKSKDKLSIFWHFNMNPGNVMETIYGLNYDMVWTNSPTAYSWLKEKNVPAQIKHLNASSQYHYPYLWDSKLYHEDVVYVGGYQPFYKGKSLIDKFIKPCMNKEFKFSIYGNRLWQIDTQRQALKIDSSFKPEYYDESYEQYYRGILPMQDFNILAKNAKIWINMNAITQSSGWKMINDRPIWLLACGGFCITDDTEESRAFFNSEGEESCPIVFSSGDDDLVHKIRYYLDNEKERLKIASRGPEFIRRKKLFTSDTVFNVIETYNQWRLNSKII